MPPLLRNRLSYREWSLILLGAFILHVINLLFYSGWNVEPSDLDDARLSQKDNIPMPNTEDSLHGVGHPTTQPAQSLSNPNPQMQSPPPVVPNSVPIEWAQDLPETAILSHAPGWTIYKNLYMSEGTLFVVSPHH